MKPVRKPVRRLAPAKKAAPVVAPAPAKASVKQSPVKLEAKLEGMPLRGDPNSERLKHGHGQLPYDCPVYVTVTRLVSDHDAGVEGYVLSLDCFTYGRTVHVRLGKKKGWRRGHSPDTSSPDPDMIKVWVGKKLVYKGEHDDEDNIYQKG